MIKAARSYFSFQFVLIFFWKYCLTYKVDSWHFLLCHFFYLSTLNWDEKVFELKLSMPIMWFMKIHGQYFTKKPHHFEDQTRWRSRQKTGARWWPSLPVPDKVPIGLLKFHIRILRWDFLFLIKIKIFNIKKLFKVGSIN